MPFVVPQRLLALVALALGAWIPVRAQSPLPAARLTLLQPAGGRVGSTVDVVAQGSDLDEPTGLMFSRPGLAARPRGGGTFEVSIPQDATPGIVDVRFVGRFGVSNPRGFEIASVPTTIVAPTNTAPASAFALAIDSIAQARTTANAVDHYTVSLKKGQRVVARVLARELDSRLEPVLAVFGPDGREIERVRRPFLDITAAQDGGYGIRVHDGLFRGGDEYGYRLTATTGPLVDFAVPNVLRAGTTNRVVLHGRNLPGGKPGPLTGVDGRRLEELAVEVVAPAAGDGSMIWPRRSAWALDGFTWSFRGSNGVANPVAFMLSTNAVVVGPMTNGLAAITAPSEVTGRFQARGGLSGATFAAKKGEVLSIEVFADRLGLHSDPSAVIQRQGEGRDSAGNPVWADVMDLPELDANLGDRDFNTSSRDCAGRFEAPADGTFRVVVRDLYNLGAASPHHVYRLCVRRETPDFRLAAVPLQPPRPKDDNREIHPSSPLLRRGGTLPVRVLASRRDGFGGEIVLGASGLPKGCSATGKILPGQNSGMLFLTVGEDAAAWGGIIRVTGRARLGDADIERAATAGSVTWHLPDFDQSAVSSRLTAGLPLAIMDSEQTPVVVTASQAKPLEAATDGKLSIPVTVQRRGDFAGAFNLKPAGRPELDKAKDTAVAEKGTNATVEINLAEFKLPEGVHTLWLQGQCAGKYRNQPEVADAADREAKAAEKEAADAAAAAKKAVDERAALKDPAPDAKAAADKRVADTAETAKAAESKKGALAQKAKDFAERAKPRDVVVPVYSAPFTVKITAPAKPTEKK